MALLKVHRDVSFQILVWFQSFCEILTLEHISHDVSRFSEKVFVLFQTLSLSLTYIPGST